MVVPTATVSEEPSANLVGHRGQAVPAAFPGNADSVCSTPVGDQEVRDRCVPGASRLRYSGTRVKARVPFENSEQACDTTPHAEAEFRRFGP